MGVDYYPCGDCDGTYCDCGDYFSCKVCDKSVCMTCGHNWFRSDVCLDCTQTVKIPSKDEVFEELLKRYRALPGADLTINYNDIRDELRCEVDSRYTKWKRENNVHTDDDSDDDSDDDADEESEKNVETCAKKQRVT